MQLVGLPAGAVTVVIIDAAGRTVSTHQLYGSGRQVSVAELLPGIHTLSVRNATVERHVQLWVE